MVKPDICGPDFVTTATAGTQGFGGTSAATPHIAAVAALVKGHYPSYTNTQLRDYLERHGVDLYIPGKDNQCGSGPCVLGPGNEPPWLMPGEGLARVGSTNFMTLCSGDPDWPPNPLTYSLLGSVPEGLTIDSSTGVLRWAPTGGQVGNYTARVRLCDGGTPNYCVTNTIAIAVTTNAPFRFTVEPVWGNNLVFTLLNGNPPYDYILQAAPALCGCPCQTVWTNASGRFSPIIFPYSFTSTVPDLNTERQMLYRLIEVPPVTPLFGSQ